MHYLLILWYDSKEYNKKRKELRRWKCHTDWKKNKKAMKKLENSSYNILYMSIQNNDYEINIPISKGRFPPMVDCQIWRYENRSSETSNFRNFKGDKKEIQWHERIILGKEKSFMK